MFSLPPLHPIFVHFPLAMLPCAALFDVIGKLKRRPSLAHAAWWSLLAATAMSPLTAASGWLWFRDMEAPSGNEMIVHKWMGTIIPILLILLAIWRYRAHTRNAFPSTWFLTASIAVVLIIMLQGHVGGTMSFGDVASTTSASSQPDYERTDLPAALPTTRPDDYPTTSLSTDDDGWLDSIKVKGRTHE